QGTTLDDIAKAANISRRTFYSYFGSKDELLQHIYREVITTGMAAVRRIAAQELPAQEKLRRLIRHQISSLANYRALLRVFFTEVFSLSGVLTRSVAEANRSYSQIFERVIADGVQSGELLPVEPRRFSYLLLGMCNWIQRWYQPGGEWTEDAIAEEIIEILEGGYLRRSPEISNGTLMEELRAIRLKIDELSPVRARRPASARPRR
ncbi:MAG: TetR/AcrR family transcriptional regulator, partial [Deltaproteobacteria bacterium]|nr:TetR/AcrR family transcriptional regulator [Deltaproteobacteria bacterium]